MKCPICKETDLYLYRCNEIVYLIPITKKNTFSKRKSHNIGIEYETEMDHLQCDKCGKQFHYDLDEGGKIITDSIGELEF